MKTNSHADPTREKREAYHAASTLLAKQDEESIRYAALELRRCSEAIVYEKLKIYGELLPEGSLHQWQPPQAFEALIAIEPGAEATSTYAVALQTELGKMAETPLKPIGVDERPKGKWIKKTWHKLGFYLHADWPFAVDKPKPSPLPFLEKTLTALAPMVNNTFTAMISMTIAFTCAGCGLAVKVMEAAVESSRRAVCLIFGMPHRAEKSDGNFTFYPEEPPFTCECGASTFVPSRQLEVGYKFCCRSCQRIFQIVGADWKYAEADDLGASGSDED
jgi:hypothetical protein